MTELADVINVTVNVADTQITRTGFGTPLIFSLISSAVFPERGRVYPNLAAVAVDFAATTKVYKAANAIFSQKRAPTKIKVGRRDAGDASHTAALNAIEAEDSDFYCVLTDYKLSAAIVEIAAWTEAKTKIFAASSEDADVLDSGVATDVASLLKAAGYNRTLYNWHHQAGVDVTGAAYTVTGGVATITQAAHGLKVGDPVTFSNSTGASIDGDNTVVSVPTSGTYTVATTAVDEAGPVTVDYFARYTFPECAWAGYMLPSYPGSETWKFKALTGVVPVPKTILTPTEEFNALAKNANLYTALAGVGHTHEGVMASGRFIDIQRGIDWIKARISEAIATRLLNSQKVPYTDAGMAVFEGDIANVLDLAVTMGILGPILDNSGDYYRITIPKVADQLAADRAARTVKGITIQAQMAGAVHSLDITVNAQI